MSQITVNDFIDKSFLFEGNAYHVQEVYLKNSKFHIKTSARMFVYDDEQFGRFVEKVEFIKPVSKKKLTEPVPVAAIVPVFDSGKVTAGLMSVFEQLDKCDAPSDDLLKKAKAMSDVAGTIVNMGKLQLDLIKQSGR